MRLSEIAARLECDLRADSDPEICRVIGIENAGPGDLTFVSNRRYRRHLHDTAASAIIVGYDVAEVALPTLRAKNPYLIFAKALELFCDPISFPSGVHPTAEIDETAQLGENPTIGPHVVIYPDCKIGSNVVCHAHSVLYPGVQIGNDVVIHSHVSIREHCRVGDRVVIQNGVVVGGDGFGFAPMDDETYYKIPQTGYVILEDDVEIGANSAIDRAAVGVTVIRRGTKIDNLVQVGHGSEIGSDSVVAAQSGFAGSTRVGSKVKIAGQAGFAGHLKVGDGATITAQSGVNNDLTAGRVFSGYPAVDNSLWRRSVAAFNRLPEFIRRLRAAEREIALLRDESKKT